MTTEAFDLVCELPCDLVRGLLEREPLGQIWLVAREARMDLRQPDMRLFLYDLLLARPALWRDAQAVRRQWRAQGMLAL